MKQRQDGSPLGRETWKETLNTGIGAIEGVLPTEPVLPCDRVSAALPARGLGPASSVWKQSHLKNRGDDQTQLKGVRAERAHLKTELQEAGWLLWQARQQGERCMGPLQPPLVRGIVLLCECHV